MFFFAVKDNLMMQRYVCIPGTTHAAGLNPNYAVFRVESEAFRLAIQEYLVK